MAVGLGLMGPNRDGPDGGGRLRVSVIRSRMFGCSFFRGGAPPLLLAPLPPTHAWLAPRGVPSPTTWPDRIAWPTPSWWRASPVGVGAEAALLGGWGGEGRAPLPSRWASGGSTTWGARPTAQRAWPHVHRQKIDVGTLTSTASTHPAWAHTSSAGGALLVGRGLPTVSRGAASVGEGGLLGRGVGRRSTRRPAVASSRVGWGQGPRPAPDWCGGSPRRLAGGSRAPTRCRPRPRRPHDPTLRAEAALTRVQVTDLHAHDHRLDVDGLGGGVDPPELDHDADLVHGPEHHQQDVAPHPQRLHALQVRR